MKKITINKGFIGLVFNKGNYSKTLTEGDYWFWQTKSITLYDMAKPFYPQVELNILLQDKDLAELLTIIEVADNEIVLQYTNGNFKAVLSPGRYAFWKGINEYSFVKVDLSKAEITEDIPLNILSRPELLNYIRVYSVESSEKGFLFKNGKAEKILEPGQYYFWKNHIPISILKADMRQQQLEISGQEILSKDKASVRLSFFVKYQIKDITKALIENKESEKQLYIVMQLALREYLGNNTLDEMLERKERIVSEIQKSVSLKAQNLGIEIIDCGIRDVILPGEMKEIMNHVLLAEKRAQANIITRREETASTRSLLNTAKLMEENAMLFKLKEMEYVEKIAERINSISLSGSNQIVEQFKTLFSPK